MSSPLRPGEPLARPAASAMRSVASRLPPPSRQRRAPTSGQLVRRRFVVAVAKRALPLAALGVLAMLALWPEIEGAEDRARLSFKRVLQARPDAVRVVEPRYQGLDEQGRPFTLSASTAVQAGSEDVVALDQPRADLLLSDGAWVYLESREGRFDKPRNHLDLAGQVTVHHDDGTQFVTEQAALDLTAGAAEGDRPVSAQGPFGTLTADGFRLRDRGQVVVFTGQARTVLEGAR